MYEIDFLQVTTTEKSGDAIAMRFTRPDNDRLAVVVIDAGYTAFGDTLADHIKGFYETSHIDLVISTHPDADHFNGIGRLLERMTVGELMVHQPNLHGHDEDEACAGKVKELVGLASDAGIRVAEPFYDVTRFGGALTVLGPTRDYYETLLSQQVEEVKKASRFAEVLTAVTKAAKKPLRLAEDLVPLPTPFTDDGGTSARNNTSAVVQLLLEGGTRRILFTGDAGVPALLPVADALEARGDVAVPLELIQIPHHGSRHNGSNELLDRLLGRADRNAAKIHEAMISASKDAPKHPSPKIVNEYKLRRCFVRSNETGHVCHHHDTPTRPGWNAVPELPFLVDGDERENPA